MGREGWSTAQQWILLAVHPDRRMSCDLGLYPASSSTSTTTNTVFIVVDWYLLSTFGIYRAELHMGAGSVHPQSASPSPLMLTRAIRTATTKYWRRLVRPPPTKREYQDFIFEVQPPINICTQRDLLLCCIHRASSLLIWELLLWLHPTSGGGI